jgi:hypothetical protein
LWLLASTTLPTPAGASRHPSQASQSK